MDSDDVVIAVQSGNDVRERGAALERVDHTQLLPWVDAVWLHRAIGVGTVTRREAVRGTSREIARAAAGRERYASAVDDGHRSSEQRGHLIVEYTSAIEEAWLPVFVKSNRTWWCRRRSPPSESVPRERAVRGRVVGDAREPEHVGRAVGGNRQCRGDNKHRGGKPSSERNHVCLSHGERMNLSSSQVHPLCQRSRLMPGSPLRKALTRHDLVGVRRVALRCRRLRGDQSPPPSVAQ